MRMGCAMPTRVEWNAGRNCVHAGRRPQGNYGMPSVNRLDGNETENQVSPRLGCSCGAGTFFLARTVAHVSLDGISHQASIGGDAEPFHHPIFVKSHGAVCDTEAVGNTLHRIPGGQQSQNLVLAVGHLVRSWYAIRLSSGKRAAAWVESNVALGFESRSGWA